MARSWAVPLVVPLTLATAISLSCGVLTVPLPLPDLMPGFDSSPPSCPSAETAPFCHHWDWCDAQCDWVIACTGPADARARAVACTTDADCPGTVSGSTRQYCAQVQDHRLCLCTPG